MSYGTVRANAQNAVSSSNPKQALEYLAEAIRALSRTVENDIAKLEREMAKLKRG